MSVASKLAYRNGFLKSERWKAIRLERLALSDATCAICRKRDLSNDAHHVFYPKRWKDTKPYGLVILCRWCHGQIHRMMRDKDNIKTAAKGWKIYKECREIVLGIRTWLDREIKRLEGHPCEFCRAVSAKPIEIQSDTRIRCTSLCERCQEAVLSMISRTGGDNEKSVALAFSWFISRKPPAFKGPIDNLPSLVHNPTKFVSSLEKT